MEAVTLKGLRKAAKKVLNMSPKKLMRHLQQRGREGHDAWLKDLAKAAQGFIDYATPDEVRAALKAANYELYTGINPDTLVIKPPLRCRSKRQ